jgi:Ankyrin repeats (3 copies)
MSKLIEEAVIKLYEAIELGDVNNVNSTLSQLFALVGNLGDFIESDYYLTKDFGFGTTFLEWAVQNYQAEIVNVLIDSGMNINTLGGSSSPLMEAVILDKTDAAQLLIDKGADIEFKDEYDVTPLMSAASSGNLELVKILIKSGANPIELDGYERTAIQHAAEEGYQEVVQYLIDFVSDKDAEAAILECNDGEGAKARKKRQRRSGIN